MFFIQQNSSPLFFISRSSAFSVIHIRRKNRLGFDSCQQTFLACMFCFPKENGLFIFMWTAFITNRGLSCLNVVLVVNVTFDTGLDVGVDGRTDGHDYQIFSHQYVTSFSYPWCSVIKDRRERRTEYTKTSLGVLKTLII